MKVSIQSVEEVAMINKRIVILLIIVLVRLRFIVKCLFAPTTLAGPAKNSNAGNIYSFFPLEDFADYDNDGVVSCFNKRKVREHVDNANEICITREKIARARANLNCPTVQLSNCPTVTETKFKIGVARDGEKKSLNSMTRARKKPANLKMKKQKRATSAFVTIV
jgi:hypothetical protein